MHLVLGITGKVGGAAARHLLKQSYGVAGLVPIKRACVYRTVSLGRKLGFPLK